MRRANFRSLRISAASRCSILSSEPRAGFIIYLSFSDSTHRFVYCIRLLLFHQQDFLGAVDLAKFDLNNLIFGGLHSSSDECGFNRQLAMAAVDQHTQLEASGTAHAKQRVHGGTRCAASVKHVVYQHHRLILDGNAYVAFLYDGLGTASRKIVHKIVSIEGNIEGAEQYRLLLDTLNNFRQPLGQGNAATPYADEGQIFDAIIFFENLMGQPDQGALYFGGRHQLRFLTNFDGTTFAGTTGSAWIHKRCIIRVQKDESKGAAQTCVNGEETTSECCGAA